MFDILLNLCNYLSMKNTCRIITIDFKKHQLIGVVVLVRVSLTEKIKSCPWVQYENTSDVGRVNFAGRI